MSPRFLVYLGFFGRWRLRIHARAAAVLVDEFDAGVFQCTGSAATVEVCASKVPGFDLRRLMVGSEIEEASAKWRCSHRKSALAARITSLLRMVIALYSEYHF